MMAMAPAPRLLLPMRTMEAPHPSPLSSASLCSAAGSYPHFSLFFSPPHPPHRTSSISTSQHSGPYKPPRGHAGETGSVEELRNPFPEDRFGGDFNGRARSARQYGRADDGSGSRRAWEPGNYPPWKKRGASAGGAYTRQNRPPPYSYGGSNSLSSASDDYAVEAFHEQKADDRRGERLGWEPRRGERDGYGRPSNAFFDRRNASQGRQAEPAQSNAPAFQSLGEGNTPNSFSYGEYRSYREQKADPQHRWSSNAGTTQKSEQQPDRRGRFMSYTPNRVVSLQPPAQSSFSMQSIVKERKWEERQVQRDEGEERRSNDVKLDVQKEPEKDSALVSSSPSISKIIERLCSIEDRIPPLHAKEYPQPRSELADVLALPNAKDYLSDRTPHIQAAEKQEKGAPVDSRFPWERSDTADKKDSILEKARRARPLSPAELAISGPELRRLRILAVHLKQRVKIGKPGVTKDVVETIHRRFRTCEVVKVKCEGPPAGNMKKTIETLEEKTGGLVIWRAGSITVLYRGQDYGQPVSEIVDDLLAKKYESLVLSDGPQPRASEKHEVDEVDSLKEARMDAMDGTGDSTSELNLDASLDPSSSEQFNSDSTPDNASKGTLKRSKTSGPEFESLQAYVLEVDDILKDLGPRYEDWTGSKPVPIDADLLPKTISNYSPPYRLLPFGVKPSIGNTYATHLRRLSRPLAPHFIIGRDRDLQGLALAMIKLWEKSEIAKIGVKRGVLNTNHERIAEDLKRLTGGFFLCRDKYSMTFYRGKDFLPPTISGILADRQTRAQVLQVEEERKRADGSLKITESLGNSGSQPSWVHTVNPDEQIRLKREAARTRRIQVIAYLERKIKMALQKKEKAGLQLEKVEKSLKPVAPTQDKEVLTNEEKFMLKKLGLKMKAFLLLGRRGVFSGVVQNMHLHWKHRELVKIVVKERDPVQLNETARMLEAESGGILISVDPTSKGFAIVVYRGKNYTRPPELRPANLLTKRLALQRSLEIQRRQSLTRYMQGLEEEIAHLRAGLSKMKILDATDQTDESVLEKQSYMSDITLTNDTSPGDFTQESSEVDGHSKLSRQKLRNLCEMGPIFKAVRLSKLERHQLRNEVLNLSKAPHFLVGRSHPMAMIAKSIRLYFLDHAFVKIGVNYRPRGTSVQDVVEELEDLTGGAAYAQDDFRVVLYRGWPTGEDMPLDGLYDVLSPEQLDILEEDEDEDENDEDDDKATMQDSMASAVVGEMEGNDEDEENLVEEMSSLSVSDEDHDVNYEGPDDQLKIESSLVRSPKLEKLEESDENLEYEDEEDLEYNDEEMRLWNMPGEDEDGGDEAAKNRWSSEFFRGESTKSSDDEIDTDLFWDEFSEGLAEDGDEDNSSSTQSTMISTVVTGSADDSHMLSSSNVVHEDADCEY